MLPFEMVTIAIAFAVGVAYFLGYLIGEQDALNSDDKLCNKCNSTIYKLYKE